MLTHLVRKFFPGELGKALKIIAGGGDVDYVGASAVELIGAGESAGNYREILVKGGKKNNRSFPLTPPKEAARAFPGPLRFRLCHRDCCRTPP
ncbi:MAG: hypothetical protein CM1200mP41_15500 [Gammaproteobacteria bacterium]|nr:MAG: hypothetical protein CM1200mP41_15500 [Gammaproteobacteria bacterium]